MKRCPWLVLVWLVITALLLVSCGQSLPETSSIAEKESETVTTTSLPASEPKPASFSVGGLTISPSEVTSGSSVTIEALVTNTGELPGTCEVILKIDDAAEDTETVTLEGAASQKVTFKVTKYTARTYSVSIDSQSGAFSVKARPASTVVQTPPPPLPDMDDFMKGIHFNDWNPYDEPAFGYYRPPGTDRSLENLADTGANWVSIIVKVNQEKIRSTTIFSSPSETATDSELIRVIQLAHSLGIRVALLPALFFSDDPSHSWVEIGNAFTNENQWEEWFASYREHINHYASFAQEAGVDLFFIGSELPGVTHREEDWRLVIQEVRERYSGLITYDSVSWGFPNPEYKRIKWWDAVDFISTDFWFSVTSKNDPTVEELKKGWIRTGFLTEMESISRKFDKPVILSEIGYDSIDGFGKCSHCDHTGASLDLQEQADCYQAALETLWEKPWLRGIFWWQWFAETYTGGPTDNGGTPWGKPAEEILKQYYLQK